MSLVLRGDRDRLAGMIAALRTLLAGGARVDLADRDSWQPLHYASARLLVDAVELLIGAGASPNTYTISGHTPLTLACSNGSAAKVVRALVKGGARVGQAAKDGLPAIRFARDPETAIALLEAGAQVDPGHPLSYPAVNEAVERWRAGGGRRRVRG